MTPEERAAMEAAEGQANGAPGEAPLTAPGSSEASTAAPSSSHAASALVPDVPGRPTPVVQVNGVPTDTAGSSHTSLAHHSSFSKSSNATPAASTDQLSKKPTREKEKKGRPKMSPEQKEQLEALERKQAEEKSKRSVQPTKTHSFRPGADSVGSRT